MSFTRTLPDLENRFLPPSNWQTGHFNNPLTGHHIHYSALPAIPNTTKATVVILPGLSEFGEKYIETARFFAQNNFDVYIIDWAYQGRSSRYPVNRQKRYSDGYLTDVSDLDHLIGNIIKTDKPLLMLAHSMGANIGLRYLLKHPDTFKAAALSTPLLGIKDLSFLGFLTLPFLTLLKPFHQCYIPGGRDWHEEGKKSFSHDPVRDHIYHKWSQADPQLQVGNPTLKWIYESLKSASYLIKNDKLKNIKIPVLLATVDQEVLVDNAAIKKAASLIKKSNLLELQNARHEILMETDDVRDKFLSETLKIFNQ